VSLRSSADSALSAAIRRVISPAQLVGHGGELQRRRTRPRVVAERFSRIVGALTTASSREARRVFWIARIVCMNDSMFCAPPTNLPSAH
jgi:hypothetical protein